MVERLRAGSRAETARAYRAYRVARGCLSYADRITLALELFQDPAIARALRERDYRVILDEAQDTDPGQFQLLLECARPVSAQGDWLATGEFPPRHGHFSMVGDLQQSIFGQRADLGRYRAFHERLTSNDVGKAPPNSTTFRCDQRIVDFVNATFPDVFSSRATGRFRCASLPARTPGPARVLRWAPELPEDFDPEITRL